MEKKKTFPTLLPKKRENSDDSVFLILILCLVLVHLQLNALFCIGGSNAERFSFMV